MRIAWIAPTIMLLGSATAQQREAAGDVSEPVKTFGRALDIFFADAGTTPTERSLFLLVDGTESLAKTNFATEVQAALTRNSKALSRTEIGVARVGVKGCVILHPTRDATAISRAVRAALRRPSKSFQNVYADLRTVAGVLKGKSETRGILLATLDNGDAEDDLEGTVARLQKLGVPVSVIATEAYLADSYYASHPYETAPRGTTLRASDGPFIDLPWGWMFQATHANELTPSGYANYGLTRIAAATGGRVFLHAPPTSDPHECSYRGSSCRFCPGDHQPVDQIYWDARVRLRAPSALSRKDAYKKVAAHPAFRAVLKAWRAAARAGVIGSQPPKRHAGTTTKDNSRVGRLVPITVSLNFKRNAVRARKAAAECERILRTLEKDLARAKNVRASPRQSAMADLTRFLVQLTKVNLVGFAGWCEEIAPGLFAKTPPRVEPPELPRRRERRPTGIAWTNTCLCHGVRPFFELELPGGEAMRRELAKLDRMATEFLKLYSNTPYAVALHRSNIAIFHVTYPGIAGRRPRPRPKGKRADDPVTTPERGRPKRAGRTGTRSGGATTGK